MAKDESVNPEEIQVHIPEHVRRGVYANITNINGSKREVTINFIYVNPQDQPQGTMVSRVILTRDHAEELIKALKGTLETLDELEG